MNSIRAEKIRPGPASKNQLRRIMLYKQDDKLTAFRLKYVGPMTSNPSNTAVPKDLQSSLFLTREAIMSGKMGILSHLSIGPVPAVPWLMSCLRRYHLG